jgi:hypothetical protein
VLLTVVSTGVRASAAAASRSSAAESRASAAESRASAAEFRASETEFRASETEIPAARDDNLRAEYLIRSDEDGGAHLTAALKELNAAYAPRGRLAVAVANEAVLTRQRIAERIGALDRMRQSRH